MRGQDRVRRQIEATVGAVRHQAEKLHAERAAGRSIPLPHENFRYRHFLMPTYLDYVSRVSWADHAVSLSTAACLLQICEETRPARLLDTGSGYSSYVLRRYARQAGAQVVSVDDDVEWMQRTADYLGETGMSTTGLITWAEFSAQPPDKFDLIFHDLGTHAKRVESMQLVADLAKTTGLIVYDDMQIDEVRVEARRVCADAGRRYFSMRAVTLDEINRYAGIGLPR